MFARLFGVMTGVGGMAMRDMGMVAGLFVISSGVMLGRCAMVFRSMFVMFGSFQVVLFSLFRHGCSLSEIRISA
jgi:hypothetical protein